jgi:Uma2 family endonuclease
VEILANEDTFTRVMSKCKFYGRNGIPVVALLDPDERQGWVWENDAQLLRNVGAISLPNGRRIELTQVFEELDAALR